MYLALSFLLNKCFIKVSNFLHILLLETKTFIGYKAIALLSGYKVIALLVGGLISDNNYSSNDENEFFSPRFATYIFIGGE